MAVPLHAFLLVLLLAHPIAAEIIQVQVVHRHGARNPLQRSTRPGAGGRVGLLPDGVEQLESLGAFMREQYIAGNTSRIRDIPVEPQLADVAAFSSNFPRTLLSSRAFLNGLYPDLLLPTLVLNEHPRDWRLRGYALCSRFHDDVTTWFRSDAFLQRKSEDDPFLIPLAKMIDPNSTDSLETAVNIYDRFLIVEREYESMDESLEGLEPLPSEDFQRLKETADWVETNKFDSDTAGKRVAGGLMTEILRRAETRSITLNPDGRELPTRPSSSDRTNPVPDNLFVEYSAHYPTLLSLLAVLREDQVVDDGVQSEIPDFGAALIFEVHHDEGTRGSDDYIKLRWYEGEKDRGAARDIAVGRAPCTDASMGCKLSDLENLQAKSVQSRMDFCKECETNSPLCNELQLGDSSPGGQEAAVGTNGCSTGGKVVAGGIGVACGVVASLLVAFVVMRCNSKRIRRGLEEDFDVGPFTEGNVTP